jgi:hypothetical protein
LNRLELICFGDKSIHIVNGHVVMAPSKLLYKVGTALKPLVKGRIHLQSKNAEVFYKKIETKKINHVLTEYLAYFK